MDHAGPTTLQQRPVRAVRLVAVRVDGGPDAGRDAGGDAKRVVTVGTAQDCDLALTDSTVSRYHLEVRHAADGLALVDLGSRNGTFVGGIRIERAVVPPGTRVKVGANTLVVDDAGARAAPAAAEPLPGVIAHSPAMRDVVALARRLASVSTSVLVEGETGVGKEVVARAIHEAGPRRAGPFVVVDCGSLPATLIASQLFGHEKGAFTGADARRAGAFERANGGTLFLDEIGELPLDLQPALLGVLERQRFTRVGGAEPVDIDVRVLAATHRDLRGEVNTGGFRADLYFRLAVARIVIPPLRERPEDLEPLVESLVERFTGVPVAVAGEHPLASAMDAIRRQRWPGNVRELRNVVEAAIVLGELPVGMEAAQVAASATTLTGPAIAPSAGELSSYRDAKAAAITDFERAYLTDLMTRAGGNVSAAARLARMDRPYLIQLLRRHELK
ncbi:MAG TPA: sigma 54-interacting transcriptional regulator [Kofleriaceae bacterium]|nr:sigma 54-interacting transcriptional regulator [Kofleriaceae bacterium]